MAVFGMKPSCWDFVKVVLILQIKIQQKFRYPHKHWRKKWQRKYIYSANSLQDAFSWPSLKVCKQQQQQQQQPFVGKHVIMKFWFESQMNNLRSPTKQWPCGVAKVHACIVHLHDMRLFNSWPLRLTLLCLQSAVLHISHALRVHITCQ